MLRRLYIAGAIVSALLCITFIATWARLYPLPDGIRLKGRLEGWRLASWKGAIGFDNLPQQRKEAEAIEHKRLEAYEEALQRMQDAAARVVITASSQPTPAEQPLAHTSTYTMSYSYTFPTPTPARSHTLPIYPLAIATSLWPAGTFFLFLRRRMMLRRRRREGRCLHCGYDLRATEAGETLLHRCPECGRESVSSISSSALPVPVR